MAVHAQVETAESVARQAVTAALENNGVRIVVFHDARNDRLEDRLVGSIIYAVSEGAVDCVIFALADADISELTGTGEILAVLVKRHRHDSIRRVESLLDTISVVYVDIDIQDALVESQQLEDTEDDV